MFVNPRSPRYRFLVQMILPAHCLGSIDVPPLMLKIPANAGYDEVARKLTEALLQSQPGEGEAEVYLRQVGCLACLSPVRPQPFPLLLRPYLHLTTAVGF